MYHLVHTTPNHHPSKMDVLPKTYLQIILAVKWLVRHWSTSLKQQRRPLPSLLCVSSSVVANNIYDCRGYPSCQGRSRPAPTPSQREPWGTVANNRYDCRGYPSCQGRTRPAPTPSQREPWGTPWPPMATNFWTLTTGTVPVPTGSFLKNVYGT